MTLTDEGKYETPGGSLAETRNYLLQLSHDLEFNRPSRFSASGMPASSAGRSKTRACLLGVTNFGAAQACAT